MRQILHHAQTYFYQYIKILFCFIYETESTKINVFISNFKRDIIYDQRSVGFIVR